MPPASSENDSTPVAPGSMPAETPRPRPTWPSLAWRQWRLDTRWHQGQTATEAYRGVLDSLVQPGMALLHAGCGWDKNNISRPYQDTCQVVGVDLDPRVQDKFHSTFHLGSLNALPLEDATFDVAFSEYVVEHLDDPDAALAEMVRVLKPGGTVVMVTPNLGSYKAWGAALLPYNVHLWFGRIRYGPGHEADMYTTRFRCNTPAQIRRLAWRYGLETPTIRLFNNGPTWWVKFPGVFELFDLYHQLLDAVPWLAWLKCGLVVTLKKPQ